MITIIAAAAENDALGKDNKLLWHLPEDFKRFKKLTTGHNIIMGRKTFESLPGILPNRKHLIVSRNKDLVIKDCDTYSSLKEAVDVSFEEDEQPFIIGGGQIYKQSLPMASCIELTRVHESFEADTYFPEIDLEHWELVNEIFYAKDEKHKYDFTFQTFLKKTI